MASNQFLPKGYVTLLTPQYPDRLILRINIGPEREAELDAATLAELDSTP